MNQTTVFSKMALQAWQTGVDRASKFISECPDELLLKEIAPGKNRGVYLVGHLAAVHDMMPEILGFGKRSYPDYEAIFLKAPDKSVEKIPSLAELRQAWKNIHERLQNEFAEMTTESWFTRHESMTDADFEKEPARNKMSVLMNRTSHLAYHFGQLRLLK